MNSAPAQPSSGGYPTPQEQPPGAVASLVCAILGFTVLPLILHIAAVVLGNQAKRAVEAEPWRYTDSLAHAGRILGWIGIALALVLVLIGVLILLLLLPLLGAAPSPL